MSAQEIEEKMNLDESPCCPRRSRRKRRRLESNSEEEDETYSPKANGIPTYVKRKPLKKYKPTTTTNGITREVQYKSTVPIPIRPRPASFLSGQSFNAESSAVNRCENSVMPEGMVLPPSSIIKSNTSVPARFDSNTLQQQPSLYHTSFMNTSNSTAYIQTPIAVSSATRIILPPQPPQLTPYQSQQSSSCQSSQSLQSSPNTMVSIPNPVDKHGRSVFLLPQQKELNITLTPNIIELDSDSDDEPSIVTQQNNLMIDGSNMDDNSSKVVPVALTWENSDDDVMREEQPLREIRVIEEKNVSLSEMMLPHNRELNKLLSDSKEKLHNLFDFNNAINIEMEAQQRIKHFYYNMRDTVLQLVHINDRIIRQYIEWRRSRKTEKETSSSINESALVSQENVDIPLDMICVNDSDTESECEDQGYQITKPSDLVKDNNIIKDLLFCKTNVVHRGVGDDSVHYSADKAIQVYDTISRDYEKCIGYSMCMKTDQTKIDDSVENLPVESDKNFGKYEEQFIFYLQHIEDNGIETENTEETDSDEVSLQEVVQTNSPFISHLLREIDINLAVASTDQLENCQEKNLIDSMTKDDKSDILDKNIIKIEEIVNNSATKIQETNMQLDDNLQ